MKRSFAQAGINPSDPRAIAADSQLNEKVGESLSQNQMQALIQNFMAKSGAGQSLLSFGNTQNPLAALSTLVQAQLQA